MRKPIAIRDLDFINDLDSSAQSAVMGRGVSNAYLFSSAPGGRSQAPSLNQYLTIENFEVNNYETNNYIDKLINQTVNQSQLNLVAVQSAGGPVSIVVDQGLMGSNATV